MHFAIVFTSLIVFSELDGINTSKIKTVEDLFFRHDCSIYRVVFTQDGSRIASMGETDGIRIWDSITMKQVRHIRTKSSFSEPAFSNDGKKLAYGDLAGLFIVDGNAKPELVVDARLSPRGEVSVDTPITSVKFSGDSSSAVFADYGGEVSIIEFKSGKVVQVRKGETDPESSFDCLVRYSPDFKLVVFTSNSGAINVWSIAEAKTLTVLEGHEGGVQSLEFSPDGSRLCSGGADGTCRVWQYREGKELAVLDGKKKGCWMSGCFSPRKKDVIISGDSRGMIRVWDLTQKRIIREHHGPASGFVCMAIHPNGDYFITAGADNAIGFWNADTGLPIRRKK